jgi:ankyrin repeat protein
VEFLLECGIDVDIRAGNELTSLFLACGNGKLDVVRFLIEKGADIHVIDRNPIHAASFYGHLDIVQMLINFGTPVDIGNGPLCSSRR